MSQISERCIKCGNQGADYRHHDGNGEKNRGLYLTCTRCGFWWRAQALDENDPKTKPKACEATNAGSLVYPHIKPS